MPTALFNKLNKHCPLSLLNKKKRGYVKERGRAYKTNRDSGVPVSLREVSENTVRKSDEEIREEGKKEKETFEEKSTLLSQ